MVYPAKPAVVQTFLTSWLCVCVPTLAAQDWVVTGPHAVVTTDSAYASNIGLEILQSGGNAVDAAIAVSFALAVTRPYSTGLGGGAFTIIRFADGTVVVQDSRETAPAAAQTDMYSPHGANPLGVSHPSLYGALAVAVPGLVAGRHELWRRYGSISFEKLAAPAARLAEEGFPVDEHYVDNANDALALYEKHQGLKTKCGYVYQQHLRGGAGAKRGETLRQPALARLLRAVGEGGADAFYRGPIADAMVSTIQKLGGIITRQDLATYKVKYRGPIRGTYRGLDIITMPPPSSGGIALLEALNILEVVDHAAIARRDPIAATHYQIEAMKHAFADRARWLGDTDFVQIPQERLLSKENARKLAAGLRANATKAPEAYGVGRGLDDAGTSHFCIVDENGTVVVSTETINTEFGSLVAVDEWGLILNNEMDDFAAAASEPNAYGLIQSSNNRIEPGKRPLSSMTPTIVLKDGSPYLMLGGSGGPRIISSVLNVFLGVVDYGRDLATAMEALRPHHQWSPDLIYFDRQPGDDLAQALIQRGHKVAETRKTGVIQAIVRDGAVWKAASDPRKGGRPAGY